MNRSFKHAFTLIELLVVIAIIAILAAILFPVFAQAKDTAKDTQSLSNLKQVALGNLMYATDYDDAFALSAQLDANGWNTWQTLVQPYVKNWGIFTTPKMTQPHGENEYWHRMQYYGTHPRAAISNGDTDISTFSWDNPDWTGGDVVLHDGIMGAGIDPNEDFYGQLTAPSLSQTAVENTTMAMVMDATNWDMWFGVVGIRRNVLDWCWHWGADGTPWGAEFTPGGPNARKRAKTALIGCIWQDGQVIYAAIDGSARSADLRGKFYAKKQLSNGTFVLPLLWPGSVN